jgi:phosphoribosylanthranilate isomerase
VTRVKICGITNLEDAMVAAEGGADLIGFVFVPASPRYIEPERAAEIVSSVKTNCKAPRFVGVFVNESLAHIRTVAGIAQLDLVQLHGDEPMSMVRMLSPQAYKALRPRDEAERLAQLSEYRASVHGNEPAFIVDAFGAKTYGGTGQPADWNLAARMACEFPILLAGGLNPENVAEAIRAVRPWGVDVSSGVEWEPGVKDHEQIMRFIQVVKGAQ